MKPLHAVNWPVPLGAVFLGGARMVVCLWFAFKHHNAKGVPSKEAPIAEVLGPIDPS